MEENLKVLIIPDVHGREFWKEPVKRVLEKTDARIVFLGDFLDPYPEEYKKGENYKENAIVNFNEIINLKKEYKDRITLLLGNHDLGYRFNLDICNCRTDYKNLERIKNIFLENKDLFQLADEEYVGEKHYIFSHAGIHKGYVKLVFENEFDKITEENVVDYFNNAYFTEDPKVINSLGMYDGFRGWGGYDYGSIVWADIHSWLIRDFDGYAYNVVGHTQLEHGCGGIIEENVADLDSAEPFIINDLGELKKYF